MVTSGFFAVLLIGSFFCGANALVEISLNGKWTATNSNKSISIPATVPGGIYTDLQKEGLIGEPYYGFNDVKYQWVGLENWTFTRKFQVPTSLLHERRVTLVAHGIDTVCSVRVNRVRVFKATNMFVRYTADVMDILARQRNNIEVSCESPVMYAQRKNAERNRTSYQLQPACPQHQQHGQCFVNLIRKMQCSFSWDWGPSFPSTGIWKPIELQGYSGVVIRDVLVTTRKDGALNDVNQWIVKLTLFYESSPKEGTEGSVITLLNGNMRKYGFTVESSRLHEARADFTLAIPNASVEPWWPSGYGKQKLYNLTIRVTVGAEVVEKTIRIAFRFVELNEDPVEGHMDAKEFYFKVNGVPIYAKGANWVPADVLPERATPEYVTDLLLSAKEANMNMLRVWGGGIYESDHFYDTADELGLLIWQDMMFASSQYPSDRDFLENVEVEVKQQVRRLHRHPSIVIWVGNNEIEETLSGGYWISEQKVLDDYRKLYIDTIMRVVEREDPSRPFVPSTPSNGRQPPTSSGFSGDPCSQTSGDTHYWNLGNDGWSPSEHLVSRFVSEHGVQSYPFKETFLSVANESSITYPFSEFLRHRQHGVDGEGRVIDNIRTKFRAPALERGIRPHRAYEAVSYLSQVYQAMALRTAAEKYRRWRSYLEGGIGHNMGFLYWQLNGIWQAPSWASIDYGGHWRMLHYFAKKFFSPVIVSPYTDRGDIKVYVINDKLTPITNASLKIYQHNWDTFSPVGARRVRVDVLGHSGYLIRCVPLPSWPRFPHL
ncbi:beta-mannosidase-like [Haemaphysalis longicornis]